MEKAITREEFLEYAEYANNLYGTRYVLKNKLMFRIDRAKELFGKGLLGQIEKIAISAAWLVPAVQSQIETF